MALLLEEYEKLISFSNYINKDYETFHQNVGYAMEFIFQYPLTVYTVFNKDYSGETYVDRIEGHTIYPEGLRQYRDTIWKSDLFVQRVKHTRHGSMHNRVLTIPDIASYSEFYATEYGKYLQNINTPHQATICAALSRSYPLHALCVFKTTEQGEFTEHELELLSYISGMFSEGVKRYIQYTDCLRFIELLREETDAARTDLAVIEERGEVIFRSRSFDNTAEELLGTRSESELLSALSSLAKEHGLLSLFELMPLTAIPVKDHTISLQCKRYPGSLKRFCIVRVTQENSRGDRGVDPPEDEVVLSLVERYGFTVREAEIARMLSQGMSNQQLAEKLCISIPTVKFHVQNIRNKLDVGSRAEAISKLLQHL